MRIEKVCLRDDSPTITLTAYVQDQVDMLVKGPRPGILICPGGAYCECSTREGEPIALRFAAMGFQAFVLQYATFFAPDEPCEPYALEKYGERPGCRYPAALLDAARAKAAINAHAKEWNVDPERIAVFGFSAGGNDAALFANPAAQAACAFWMRSAGQSHSSRRAVSSAAPSDGTSRTRKNARAPRTAGSSRKSSRPVTKQGMSSWRRHFSTSSSCRWVRQSTAMSEKARTVRS